MALTDLGIDLAQQILAQPGILGSADLARLCHCSTTLRQAAHAAARQMVASASDPRCPARQWAGCRGWVCVLRALEQLDRVPLSFTLAGEKILAHGNTARCVLNLGWSRTPPPHLAAQHDASSPRRPPARDAASGAAHTAVCGSLVMRSGVHRCDFTTLAGTEGSILRVGVVRAGFDPFRDDVEGLSGAGWFCEIGEGDGDGGGGGDDDDTDDELDCFGNSFSGEDTVSLQLNVEQGSLVALRDGAVIQTVAVGLARRRNHSKNCTAASVAAAAFCWAVELLDADAAMRIVARLPVMDEISNGQSLARSS